MYGTLKISLSNVLLRLHFQLANIVQIRRTFAARSFRRRSEGKNDEQRFRGAANQRCPFRMHTIRITGLHKWGGAWPRQSL